MHSSRMCTTHLLTVSCSALKGEGSTQPPWMQITWMQTPLDAEPPQCRPPGCRPSLWMQTPLDADPLDADPLNANPTGCRSPGHVICNAYWEANPPVNRITHRRKNITLPQTSFASGKNLGALSKHLISFMHNNCFPCWDRLTILLSKGLEQIYDSRDSANMIVYGGI